MLENEKEMLLKELRNVFLSNYTNDRLSRGDKEFIKKIDGYISSSNKGLLEGAFNVGNDPLKLCSSEIKPISNIVSRFKNPKYAVKLILNNEFGLIGNLIMKYLKDKDAKITEQIIKYDRALTRDAYKIYGSKIIDDNGFENSLEVMVNAIEINGKNINKVGVILWKERDFYRRLASICPEYLQYGEYRILDDGIKFNEDRNLMLELVKINPMSLAYIPYKYKNDYEIVHEAIIQNGHALMYASIELQDNKQIVYDAIKTSGLNLLHASERLKNDIDICVKAVENVDYAINYVGEKVRKDVQERCQILKKQKD